MGLLDGQTQFAYYGDKGAFGKYQFVTLENIINAFVISYVGENKLISKINRTDVQFHAMRAIQELSYDVFRSIKSQEIEIPPSLKMVLPHDYVNYVKLVTIGDDGIEKTLYPASKTSNPFAIQQDDDGNYQYQATSPTVSEDAETQMSNNPSVNLQEQGVEGTEYTYIYNSGTAANPITSTNTAYNESLSDTSNNYSGQTNNSDTNTTDATDVDIDHLGRRYGLDPQHAHQHGSFFIDQLRSYVHFSSNLANSTVTLKYISDGLGTDEEMVVHKFCEEAVYKWIAYGVLSTRSNMPEHIIQRFKKEKFAETRKAKIRLSNIKIEEFTQILKGLSKPIK